MKYIVIIVSCVLFVYCSFNDMEREYKLLKERKIILPEYSSAYLNGEETNLSSIEKSKLKLIIYIDSLSCNSCYLNRLKDWNHLIEYANGYDNQLSYYFIFTPKKGDMETMQYSLKEIQFNYPLIIDSLGALGKLNPQLPTNKKLHTFLLDESNNVIMVGDPLSNNKIQELLKKTVEKYLNKKYKEQ